MDGFPNGRRLEDDVTTIELQAVGGVVLAALGLWYDDFVPGGNPVTPQLLRTINFNAGALQISFLGEYDILNLDDHKLSPYVFLGVGLLHFSPYTFDEVGSQVYLSGLSTRLKASNNICA